MAAWPENPRLIGTRIPRMDGLDKASGRAKYPSDVNPKGLLFGALLISPHAHAKIKSIDVSAAEASKGVKGVVILLEAGKTLRYQGEEIAAVAAETEELARDGVRAIKIEYEVLPHVATEAQASAPGAPVVFPGDKATPNRRRGRANVAGEPEEALKKADAVVEASYSVPVITHVCLESHGLTAWWEGDDKIVAHASTQGVQATAGDLAGKFKVPVTNVEVIAEVMGGGFGSKFSADVWGHAATELAKKTGRPVKMFLDRAHEHLSGGNRPSAFATLKIAGTKDGKVTALVAETSGTGGSRGGSQFPLPYVYDVENVSRAHTEIFVNGGSARAMRAPGHPQGCIVMEAAMDDLADKLGIDPLEFRLKNLKEAERVTRANRTEIYKDQIKIGAELIGWQNRKPRGTNGKGPIKKGYGMALHQWGGGGSPDKKVACTINPDGSVEMKTGTQDIGTGARTLFAIIAAEVLGLEVLDVTSKIGHSSYPPGQASGGSTTTPSMCPPAYNAALEARGEFFKRVAGAYGAEAADLSLKGGKLLVKGEAKATWKDACRKLGQMPITVTGSSSPELSATGVGGVQFVELDVDVETGVVYLKKIVAVQDSGLILDRLTWDSQVYGGVIGGLNYGLFEERIMDPGTGVMLNPDMELYKLAGATDIPEIVLHAYETPAMKARGVIGIGEPPTIGTAAAIGNAVTNAIGVRVAQFPMSPMNILNALASKKGEA